MHKYKLTHVNNLIIGCLNINSVKSKFDQLKIVIGKNLDVLVLIETKLDSSFPTSQCEISEFSKPYRLDRKVNGGGILIYIRENIPSKLLTKHKLPYDFEGIFIELNFRKSKNLFGALYHPHNQSNNYFYENIGNALDKYIQYYDNIVLAGYFNNQESTICLRDFLEEYEAKNLVKENTCFKSVSNPNCVNLFLTNNPHKFQNTTAFSTGLSDYHKRVI